MEYLIIICLLLLMLIILRLVYSINIKKIKDIGKKNHELDKEVSKYPSNIDICKSILKILKNEDIIIQEDSEKNNCLYIVILNKIIIANMRGSFTRIQTIAHECLHSVQSKKILIFNFIYSNIYNIVLVIFAILGILNKFKNGVLYITIYVILSFVYYFVRSYLENDAMIKARYIAKEYIEKQKISSEEKIKQIIMEYDKLNDLGIKATNYNLFFNVSLKIIFLSVIMLI